MLVVGAIPLLYAAGLLPFGAFLALVACAGALRGPGDAAKSSIVPSVVEAARVPLERATGLHSTVERTASMLGAVFAGGLIAVIGAANALVVDAVSFGVSAAVLGWATTSLRRPAADEAEAEADTTPYLAQLRQGWDFLRGDRVLRGHRGHGGADQPARRRLRVGADAGLGARVGRRSGRARRRLRRLRRRRGPRRDLRGDLGGEAAALQDLPGRVPGLRLPAVLRDGVGQPAVAGAAGGGRRAASGPASSTRCWAR